jgi:hypothetical protein
MKLHGNIDGDELARLFTGLDIVPIIKTASNKMLPFPGPLRTVGLIRPIHSHCQEKIVFSTTGSRII